MNSFFKKPDTKPDIVSSEMYCAKMSFWTVEDKTFYSFDNWYFACELIYRNGKLYHRRCLENNWSPWPHPNEKEIIDLIVESILFK